MVAQMIYFADPMCSWCWGFQPVMTAVRAAFGERLQPLLIMGGLRPWTSEPLREQDKASIREHWQHVAEASGQPFDLGFFERAGFIYDTEPAARAVVTAGHLRGPSDFAYLAAAHRAFYAENRDVTDPTVLAEIAEAEGLDRAAFEALFASEEIKQETVGHFQMSQRIGVRGFPTLVVADETGQGEAITVGYAPAAVVLERLQAFIDKLDAR